jgi:hypothetical protein
MKNRFNIAEYLSSYSYSESLSADSLTSSTLSTSPINFKIDYSVFDNHIFFGNAWKRVISNINYVIKTYPIGLSGASTATLSAYEVSQVENWNRTSSMFQQHIVDFLCGATGNLAVPTVTASATSFLGEVVTVNVINRDASNNITDPIVVWNMGVLLTTASAYDEGISTFKYTSGTGSDFFLLETYWGEEKTKFIPPEIQVSVNRAMDYMRTFPDVYVENDQKDVFNNFLQIWAEFYDLIKIYIDQFPTIFAPDYSGYNRTPEGIIQYYVAKQFGVELFEGALLGELPQYYQKLGRKGLQKITYEIWNRVLCDITDLLKAKGTKTGFNRLVNDFGIYNGWITTKEFVDLLETTDNVYESDRTVKLPVITPDDYIKIQLTPITNNDFSLMFQSIEPNIYDNNEVKNILTFISNNISNGYIFYSNEIDETYKLDHQDYSSAVVTNLVTISGADYFTLRDYHSNNLMPFVLRQDFTNKMIYFDTALSSYQASLNGLAIDYKDFTEIQFGGNSLSGGDTMIGLSGSFANIKLFDKFLDSASSYILDPHSRYEEQNMEFDYKLYESPTGLLLNSFIGSSATGLISFGGTPKYDLFPINFKRTFVTHGTNIPGGDFINNSSENKRRGSNFGYGIFSAEAINNDILDYYGSTSATNISSFYIDPAYYYEDYGDKYHWKNLVNHRNTVISKDRYPDGITYTKFIKVIEKYRHILYNFFQTAEQFLRFKSRIIQKGVNIEPTLLDREKHNIDSAEITIETMDMSFTAEKIAATQPEFYPLSFTAEQINSYTTETKNIQFNAQTVSSYEQATMVLPLSSYSEHIYQIDTQNINLSAIQSYSASKTEVMPVSVSGYKEINVFFDNPSQDTTCIFTEDYITKEGVNVDDRYYYVLGTNDNLNPALKTSDTVKTILTSNKHVIETGLFPIGLKGMMPFIIFNNPALTGSGSGVEYNLNSGNVIGTNLQGVISTTTTASITGSSGLYFISTYNNVPLTGSIQNAYDKYSKSITGTFTGVFLTYDFKDMGVDTDQNYYRRYIKLNLQQQKDNIFVRNNNSIFVIDNPIEKNTKLPLFHFYCYNNNSYYRTTQFRVPSYSVNGTNLLISINPVFNGINVGKANVGITNLVTKEYIPFEINSIIDTSQYIDSDLTVFGNTGTGSGAPAVGYTTEHHTLTETDLINKYITFGGSTTGYAINVGKGIFVYLNGGLQDTTFYNYAYDGINNKITFPDVSMLVVGDIITIYYTY